MNRPAKTGFLFLLLLLFAGSGCSALIYEIVWYQLLQLAIGSTAVSLAFLLATFMGGLCLGSVAFPKLRLESNLPLRIYAALELGIAACGIAVLFGIPYIDRVYIAGAEHGLPGMLLRGFISGICLLPPTILMGASLPAIVRGIESGPRGVAWWGWLYAGNTAGAVLGCLIAGFYLLPVYNVATATYFAAGINGLVAVIAFLAAAPAPSTATTDSPEATEVAGGRSTIYIAIALSGATALGAEVIWTRLMGMMLGSTVYVFAIILAVFLAGLAIGSSGGAWILRVAPARPALGWSQVFLIIAMAWAAHMITDSLPFWRSLLDTGPWQTAANDLLRCAVTILPAALLWGASFPFALAACSGEEDSGKIVGKVYAANTLGAIVGALAVSLWLVPWIGTQQSQRLLLFLSALSACVALGNYIKRSAAASVLLAGSFVLAGMLSWNLHRIPGEVIAYGRRLSLMLGTSKVLYTIEGRNSSVAITLSGDGATEVDVNGHVEATTEPYDMKLQRMVGHLPALLHPNPKSVLGIGFGAGVSAGTFTRYPGIEKITVCEIEPVVPPTSTRYFAKEDYDVLHNPRTRIVFDDARHYLLTTRDTFDIIASDPLDVFVKGTAAIYSAEYFGQVKRHLNPGGRFSLYVPLYESDVRTVKSEIATFMAAFPYGTLWANTIDGAGYDMVFMGQLEPLKIDLDEVQLRLDRPDYAPVARSLSDIGVYSAAALFSTYAGQKSDFEPWLRGADINTDKDLRLQYIGGWGINSRLENEIYRQIISYRRRPAGMFAGSPEAVQSLLNYLSPGAGVVPSE